MEAGALVLTCLLGGGAARGQERDPLPVPDLPGLKTLKADFHLHTAPGRNLAVELPLAITLGAPPLAPPEAGPSRTAGRPSSRPPSSSPR